MLQWIYRPVLFATLLSSALAAAGREPAQLKQDPISIRGNQALPSTLYIQPWKRIGEPLGSDRLEGDIGEAADPIERDVFRRELQLHREGYSID